MDWQHAKGSIKERKELIERMERIPVQNMISMEVEIYGGSYLEGRNWDFLKHVYPRDKESKQNTGWIDSAIANKDSVSPDSLVSDFDERQSKGTCGFQSIVTVLYDEVSGAEMPVFQTRDIGI